MKLNAFAATKFLSIITSLSFSHGLGTTVSNDIKIVGLPGGGTETLPSMYVKSFPRWIIPSTRASTLDDAGERCIAEPLYGANVHVDDGSGFVDPTSTTDLWWPWDLRRLQIRPTIDVLIRNGQLSYASAGIDVRVPNDVAENGETWYNYGMNSQPLARQWTSFSNIYDPMFRVECLIGHQVTGDEANDSNSSNNGISWEKICPEQATRSIAEDAGIFVSQLDDSSPLSSGFHIVSFPLSGKWSDLPPLKEVESVKDEKGIEKDGVQYKITCIATPEPDAAELLSMDDGLIELSGTSVLNVDVSRTQAGSKSEYLPDAYKPLYLKKSEY